MKSHVDQDYGLKLWFSYKKSIPRNATFYFFFFAVKYFPVFLLTHNLKGLEDNNFSFEHLFRHMTLFPKPFTSFYLRNYPIISLVVYFFIVFSIISYYVLLASFKRLANKNEFQIYKVPSIKFPIPRVMKQFAVFSAWLFLLIIFASQYLGEYCFMGVFILYFKPNTSDYAEEFLDSMKDFDIRIGEMRYVLGALHIFFFICLFILTFAFFISTSTRTLSHKYGFQTTTMSWNVVVLIILFQIQGIYSTSMYYSKPFRDTLRLILCCITTFLLSMHSFFSFRQYDFNSHFVFIMKFIGNWCMIGGLIEIVLFFIAKEPLSQKMTVFKLIVEVVNALALTNFLISHLKQKSLVLLSQFIFVGKEPIAPNALMEYYYLLFEYVNGKDNFLQLYNIIQGHYHQCSNESCKCQRTIKKSQSLPLAEQRTFFNRLFISIGEQEIVNCIMNYDHKYHYVQMQELILLHVDFLFSIKKNYFLTFYLTHFYLEMKRKYLNLFFKYDMYEIRCLIIEKFKTEKKPPMRIIKTKLLSQSILLSSKHFEKAKSFINVQIFLEKIKIMLYSSCNDLEEVMNFKDMSLLSRTTFTCEDLLKVIHKYSEDKHKVDAVIDEYFNKSFTPNVEMSYLLKSYFNLIYGEIPAIYRKRIDDVSIHKFLKDQSVSVKDQHFILFLTNDNKLLIRYASLYLVERLHYNHNELIGSELPDLLPHFIARYHFAYMKHFLCNGLLTYTKLGFLLSKEGNLIPFNIKCKTLPTPMSLAMIVKLTESSNTNSCERLFYSILDEQFNFQAISKEFETLFYFNIKMYHAIGLNFCQLIGLNQDLVTGLFKEERSRLRKKVLLEAQKEKFFYSLLTSVKPEDYFLYKNVRHFRKNTPCARQQLKINKYHSIRALASLEKQIEGIGLERESIMKIHEVYAQLNSKGNDKGRTLTNSLNTFLVQFDFKHIGDLLYYKTTIKEYQCNAVYSPLNDTNNISKISKMDETIDQRNSFFLSEKDKFPDLGSLNKSNASFNDSKAGLMLSSLKKGSLKKPPQLKMRAKVLLSDVIHQRIRLNNISVAIKVGQIVLILSLLIIFIANVINNTQILVDSQTIFYINIYSYLLINNIYLSSLLCMRNCFVSNRIQSKPLHDPSVLKRSGTEIIEHYHLLMKHVNQLIHRKEVQRIYHILYTANPYYLIMPNWKYTLRNDTIGEEIYIIYYSIAKFDPQLETDCRVKELFYSGLFQHKPGDTNSVYERFIFYVMSNMIKRVGPKIQDLITVSNSILLEYNAASESYLIYMNSGILINGLLLFLAMSLSIVVTHKALKNEFLYLFELKEYEQDFRGEISKLKHLIVNFNREEVSIFEQSKVVNAKRNSLFLLNQMKKEKEEKHKGKGKEKAPDKGEPEEEHRKHQSLLKLSRMKVMVFTIILIVASFIIFILIQLGYILFILDWYNQRLTETMLSITFLSRIPRITELLLYSSISVVYNNMVYMLKNRTEYNHDLLSNYYKIALDVDSHSLFSKLGNSQFNYIYYQLYILQKNIEMLLNDVTMKTVLRETASFERAIDRKEDSCVYPPLYYIKANYTGYASAEVPAVFSQVNLYAKECRTVSGGINMNGAQLMIDSLISGLTSLYEDFYVQRNDERNITAFLTDPIYYNYEDNLHATLRIIHDVYAYLEIEDMIASNAYTKPIDILFTIAALLFSCGIVFVIIFFFIRKLETNNRILSEFSTLFDKGLICYQNNRNKAIRLQFEQ